MTDNATGAVNQQERLDGYISGYVDGEGTFSISVQINPSCKAGVQLIPEFHVSQNRDRCEVLEIIKERLGCGRIQSNGRKGDVLVLTVRRHEDLLNRVIPFFEKSPLLSSKQKEFEAFAAIIRGMAAGEHQSREGLRRLLALALTTNGGGKYRKRDWMRELDHLESSETIRQTTR
jgi:hypothetical protein